MARSLWLWWLVEKIGRRYTIIMGSVIIIIGVFLQSFAHGLAMFAVARVLIGEPSSICLFHCPLISYVNRRRSCIRVYRSSNASNRASTPKAPCSTLHTAQHNLLLRRHCCRLGHSGHLDHQIRLVMAIRVSDSDVSFSPSTIANFLSSHADHKAPGSPP